MYTYIELSDKVSFGLGVDCDFIASEGNALFVGAF